ncbi:MAG: sigma-70 family RNA polymerase sigma factor [Planctomycetota bacterium]|nr:sigma-70 family RNA polymerase sigma factor [Planctomycetota bacterium]
MNSSLPTPEELCAGAQGIVHMIAQRVHRQFHGRLDYDDLVGYGQLGLTQAAAGFDPAHGTRFSTFAHIRVQGAIYDGISRMTGVSRAAYRNAQFGVRVGDLFESHHAASPNAEQTTLEGESEWLGEIVEQMTVASVATTSPETMQNVADESLPPDEMIAANDAHRFLRTLVTGLEPDERTLIESMYFEGSTMEEAASRIGVSKSWASRLHARILSELGRSLRQAGVESA